MMASPSDLQTRGLQRSVTPPTNKVEVVTHKPALTPFSQSAIGKMNSSAGEAPDRKIYNFFAWFFSALVRLKNWVASFFAPPATPLKPAENQPKPEEVKPQPAPAPQPQPKPPAPAPQPQPISELLWPGMQTYCGQKIDGPTVYNESPSYQFGDGSKICMRFCPPRSEDRKTSEYCIRASSIIVTLSSGYQIRFEPSLTDYPISLSWSTEQISWKITGYAAPGKEWEDAYTAVEAAGLSDSIQVLQANFAKPATGWPKPTDFQNWFIQEAAPDFNKAAIQFTKQKPQFFSVDESLFSSFKTEIKQISRESISAAFERFRNRWTVKDATYEKDSLSIEIRDKTLTMDALTLSTLLGYRVTISHSNGEFLLSTYKLNPNGNALSGERSALPTKKLLNTFKIERALDMDGIKVVMPKAYDMLFEMIQ